MLGLRSIVGRTQPSHPTHGARHHARRHPSSIGSAISIAAVYLLARGTLGKAGEDAYAALKQRILEWIGKEHVDKLEEKPDSEGRRMTAAEELAAAGAADDAELTRLAEALKAAMLQADATGTIRQTIEKLEADTNIEINGMRARGRAPSSG